MSSDNPHPVTKGELIRHLARHYGLSEDRARRMFQFIEERIIEGLLLEGSFCWRGLGTFRVRTRAARQGRNPRTGEPVEIPARKWVQFKASRQVNELVNMTPAGRNR